MYDGRSESSKDYFPDRWLNMVLKWKVFAPFIFAATVYLVSVFLSGSDYPFRRAAAQGGLLLLSALVLMEAAFELRRVESRLNKFPAASAIAVLSLYAIQKFWFVNHKGDVDDSGARLLLALALFNCAVTLCSIIGSLYAFTIVARETASKRLLELSPPWFSRGEDQG